jgi:hypothetical protein
MENFTFCKTNTGLVNRYSGLGPKKEIKSKISDLTANGIPVIKIIISQYEWLTFWAIFIVKITPPLRQLNGTCGRAKQ